MNLRRASFEIVHTTASEAARAVAGEIAALVRERASHDRSAVLALPTGRTPLGIYDELARMVREERLSFDNVITFNLDEYLDLAPEHPCTFHSFMRRSLFERVGIDPASTHLPASDVAAARIHAHCRDYERRIADAGGIDLALLGVGRNGHIAFNEPGSSRDSRTREVTLDPWTREDAATAFGGLANVPTRAITMGVATILAARRIRVLAFGAGKSEIVARTVGDPIGAAVPAAYLRVLGDAVLYTDHARA